MTCLPPAMIISRTLLSSPGMKFGQQSPNGNNNFRSSSATKQPSASIFSSRIRESLTPPGKFHHRSSSSNNHISNNYTSSRNTGESSARTETESLPHYPTNGTKSHQ
mmetsp:Transcript_89661/g.175480  ORF Transcript_89661/g.175480 Transcript_89661/m.175480 type:complete len:107 (-) Transcript_89661:995-1315(-)